MENYGCLKGAIEKEARELNARVCNGKDETADEYLTNIAEYAKSLNWCGCSYLINAVMFYVRFSKDSDFAKDKAQRELTATVQNMELYKSNHIELSTFAAAIERIKEEKEGAK